MGKKTNNMPVRKKKLKHANNFQFQSRGGLGSRRAKGRESKRRERLAEQMALEKGVPAQLEAAPKAEEAERDLLDLAKAQEDRAACEDPEAPLSRTARKKRRIAARKAEARHEEKRRSEAELERSHLPGAGIRQGTVQFADDAGEDAAPGGGSGGARAQAAASSGARPRGSAGPWGALLQRGCLLPGASVVLVGLQGAAELNGRLATCARWDDGRARWLVRLEGGTEKLLRPENVELNTGTAPVLWAGAQVRLRSLQGSAELNGQLATCRSWDEAKRRWLVQLGEGSVRLLRPENLEVVLAPGSAVALTGLVSAASLNGQAGTCAEWREARARWSVQLEDGTERTVLPANLRARGPEEVAASEGAAAARPPACTQLVHVCEGQGLPERLVSLVRQIREEEKRSTLERSLMIVYCTSAATLHSIVELLSQKQFACAALEEGTARKRALSEFNLDQKRILVVSGNPCPEKGLRVEGVRHVVNYDFPSLEDYCRRLDQMGAGTAHSFFLGARKQGAMDGGRGNQGLQDSCPRGVCNGP